jgi:hypothetical protein
MAGIFQGSSFGPRRNRLPVGRCEDDFNIAASALRAAFALFFLENRGINYQR